MARGTQILLIMFDLFLFIEYTIIFDAFKKKTREMASFARRKKMHSPLPPSILFGIK